MASINVERRLPVLFTQENREFSAAVYIQDGTGAACLSFEESVGMGMTVKVWTSPAGMEVLRDALNAALVQAEPVAVTAHPELAAQSEPELAPF